MLQQLIARRCIMEYKEYRYDKSVRERYGEGEWSKEPDKIQYEDEATGYPCLVKRNDMGALCGYVGLPKGHPFYGKDYDSLPDLDVHGGVTYTDKCAEGGEDNTICHVPDEGEPDNVWWVGFDCAHFSDSIPSIDDKLPPELNKFKTYKTVEYVKEENATLAKQLKEAEYAGMDEHNCH
jgi:hypothetical protein